MHRAPSESGRKGEKKQNRMLSTNFTNWSPLHRYVRKLTPLRKYLSAPSHLTRQIFLDALDSVGPWHPSGEAQEKIPADGVFCDGKGQFEHEC
jgi:hypothetical protein